ncbi:MAG: outer membrane beta-barrel protein, partial [Acidobacteria bacterium]|nr:outer membrane beta-barrel protein [Acidobacteriota bacterium]
MLKIKSFKINKIVRNLLLASLFFSLVAANRTALFAQETGGEAIEKRIAALEARIRQLENELVVVKSAATLGQPTVAGMDVIAIGGSGMRPSIQPAVLVTSSEMAAVEAPDSAVAMSPPPAPMPPAQQDTLGGELEGLNFFKGVTFGGFLDGYYNFNFNEPSDAITTNGGGGLNRNFDFNHNSFTLSQVDFEVMKAVNETNPLGYMVQMAFGPTANFVNGGDFGIGNSTAAHFMQYYLSSKAGGLTLDFGKFVTQHGAEVIDTRADWNY